MTVTNENGWTTIQASPDSSWEHIKNPLRMMRANENPASVYIKVKDGGRASAVTRVDVEDLVAALQEIGVVVPERPGPTLKDLFDPLGLGAVMKYRRGPGSDGFKYVKIGRDRYAPANNTGNYVYNIDGLNQAVDHWTVESEGVPFA